MKTTDLTDTFDKLNEGELALILEQVNRRLLVLRENNQETTFWTNTVKRIIKQLLNIPQLTQEEINLINAHSDIKTGALQAIKLFKRRTGLRLRASRDIVYKWINTNSSYRI